MNISSNKQTVESSPKVIFDFISDFNHFEALLPTDKIENFKCTSDSCSFKIKGMADLALKIGEKESPSRIRVISEGGKPFPFHFDVNIAELGETSSEVFIDFEGDINQFMKMMVEKPLTNFFNMLVEKLATLDLG